PIRCSCQADGPAATGFGWFWSASEEKPANTAPGFAWAGKAAAAAAAGAVRSTAAMVLLASGTLCWLTIRTPTNTASVTEAATATRPSWTFQREDAAVGATTGAGSSANAAAIPAVRSTPGCQGSLCMTYRVSWYRSQLRRTSGSCSLA